MSESRENTTNTPERLHSVTVSEPRNKWKTFVALVHTDMKLAFTAQATGDTIAFSVAS